MIDVLITDDHPLVRRGIRQTLEDDCNQRFGRIDEAIGGREMLEKLSQFCYNIVILDISLPGRSGIDYIPDIKAICPKTAVLIVSIFSEEQYALKAFKAGASGYLNKCSAGSELVSAVIKIAAGGKYITDSLAEKLTDNYLKGGDKPLSEELSAREMEVVRLMATGLTVGDIALKLSLSPKTISTYKERILIKLKLRTTADIIRFALDNNLTEK